MNNSIFPKNNQIQAQDTYIQQYIDDKNYLFLVNNLEIIFSKLRDFLGDANFNSSINLISDGAWNIQSTKDSIGEITNGSRFPKIQVVSFSDIYANGAFSNNTIYLAKEFLATKNSHEINQVLLEEIGHYLDAELNPNDSAGDEGAIFASLVNKDRLSTVELNRLKSENDNLTVEIDGQLVGIEQAADVMGEIGRVTDFDELSKTIELANDYENPVVFALPLSRNGSHPATVRIVDIQSDRFSAYLQEPDYLDGTHTQEEFSYLVLEAGSWQLADGSIVEVGTVNTSSTTSADWEAVNFDSNFGDAPVILSQVQTNNNDSFVRTRQKDANGESFALALEKEEALENTSHGTETIGWLAIESGAGTWGGMDYQAGHTQDNVTHQWHSIDFNRFDGTPNFLASIASFDGSDAAGLRSRNLSDNGVQIGIEEDWSLDSEVQHTSEVIDYLAIEGTGQLTASSINSEPINSQPISSEAIEVGFENHNLGTKYNKTAQSQDWDVIGSKESWMNRAVITDRESYSGDQSLRITHLPNETSGGSAVWDLPSENEYYLSYRVKFADNFDFDGSRKSGGKLPGLGGRDEGGDLCSGGKTCTGVNGFSSRYMWRKNGRAELYLYHMDKPDQWGERFYFEGSDGSEKYFQRGKWHNLIQRVKINDGNQSNGEVDVWLDGEQVLSIDDLRFVNNNQGIDSLYFSTFHGGSGSEWLPEREVYSYWDDFVVSTNAADVGL